MDSTTHTTTTEETQTAEAVPARGAAISGLAIVGFIALIFIGITLAIYGARYIPAAVSELASAGSAKILNTGNPATLSVVAATTTLPFIETEVATSTVMLPTPAVEDTSVAAPTHTYPVASEHVRTLTGLPDLSVRIVATGYLANGTNESFVPAQVIPAGARAAVQFTIANDGTNATGPWGFTAQLPNNEYNFTSPTEQNMNPGDHILFTLGFDQTTITPGPQVVTIVADPSDLVTESSKTNNVETAAFAVGQ